MSRILEISRVQPLGKFCKTRCNSARDDALRVRRNKLVRARNSSEVAP
jgi:hypothetical protein